MTAVRPSAIGPTALREAAPPAPRAPVPAAAPAAPDRVGVSSPSDLLARARRAGQHHPTSHSIPAASAGVVLLTTAAGAAAIAAGAHQVRVVDGHRLAYPSQNLGEIESLGPDQPGQTHALERHVGTTLADNVARLAASPLLHAAGSYTSLPAAQYATDETIANPANQANIAAFLADPGRLKTALLRVDLGRTVGTSTLQSDLAAGTPHLRPGSTATVVLIKDPSFPEGYRVLTTYPDLRRPEAGARGNPRS